MTALPHVFVSHTTADERDLKLAHRLAAALEERGAKVWIAPESIPAGSEWNPGIVRALMQHCSHFLVIVSAASISSEWVLKEIDLARQRFDTDKDFTILPLYAGRLAAFPGSDFLSRFQRVAYYDDFHAQTDAVAQAMGLHAPVPQDLQTLIAEKTGDFVGRAYIFDAIDAFMAKHPNGYLVIEGDPGAGKTTILAEYVKRTGAIAHFNIRAQGITRAQQFLENVGARVATRFGLARGPFSGDGARDGASLKKMLDEAAAALAPEERLVIAVDALDEADTAGQPAGSNILFLPPNLPPQAYFVMTKRYVTVPLFVYAPLESLDLAGYRDGTRDDIRTYLGTAAARPGIADWIRARKLTVADFCEQLIARSECNFMYLHYVLPAIETGMYRDLRIDDLPQGLKGYYEDHWVRMGMTTKPLPRDKIKIIYVLSEVRQPVSRSQIVKYSREDALTVQGVLDEWSQFLHRRSDGPHPLYSIYHSSFADFLHRKDIVQAVKDAGVTIEGVNQLIGDTIFEDLYPE